MKHHGGCTPEQGDRGAYEWTFPSGRTYRTKPPSTVMFRTALETPDAQRPAREYTREHPYGIDEWDKPGGDNKNSTDKTDDDKTGDDKPMPF